MASPDVVPLAVGLPVSHEARARLVQVLAALSTLEAGGVPLEVGGHPQDELVVDLTPAAHARGRGRLLCGEGRTSGRLRTPPRRPGENCAHREKEADFLKVQTTGNEKTESEFVKPSVSPAKKNFITFVWTQPFYPFAL